MAKAKTPKASRPTRAKATGEDRTFGDVLRSKSVERIVPEAVGRLEAGRRAYVAEALADSAEELEILAEERRRLQREGADPARLARLDQLTAGIEVDAFMHRTTLEAVERATPPEPNGWTVYGRVLQRDGTAPKKAAVVFVADNNQPVSELGTLPVGADGFVRHAYDAETITPLVAKRARVAAAVRLGTRTIAVDDVRAAVVPNGIHQFDLKVDPAAVGIGAGTAART